MAVRLIKGSLVITRKVKPQKGDLMCCFSYGIPNGKKESDYIGRGYSLSVHRGDSVSKLNAICEGTEKVIFFLKFRS